MKYLRNITEFVRDKQVFCGIDVHEKQWTLAFFCDGEVVEQVQIPADFYTLLSRVEKTYVTCRKISFVYEAGFSGFVLCRRLRDAGYPCIVTPPNRIPVEENKVKTDKRDAAKLAKFHASGLLRDVYVPPPEVESDRRVVRRRKQLVKDQTRIKNQINAFLKLLDLKPPADVKTRWSNKHLKWLDNLSLEHDSDAFTLKQLIGRYRAIRKELLDVNKYLRYLSKQERYSKNYSIVTSVRGIGLVTGMTFILELYDMPRFKNTNGFSSYLGMTPAQFSSGNRIRLGHITREGNANLRHVLVESAWTVIRYDPVLRDKYNRLRARGVIGTKAIVAIARTLAVRLRRCILDQKPYVIGVS